MTDVARHGDPAAVTRHLLELLALDPRDDDAGTALAQSLCGRSADPAGRARDQHPLAGERRARRAGASRPPNVSGSIRRLLIVIASIS